MASEVWETIYRMGVKLCAEDEYDCKSCDYKSSNKEQEIQDFLVQVILDTIDTTKDEISEELLRDDPEFNDQWLRFTWFFEDQDVQLRFPLATQLASHVGSYLTIYWGIETSRLRTVLPPEIRNLIFIEALKQEKIRQLPPADIQLPHHRSAEFSSCETCSVNCRMCCDVRHLLLEDSWEVETVHVDEPTFNHSSDCDCDRLILEPEEYEKLLKNDDPFAMFDDDEQDKKMEVDVDEEASDEEQLTEGEREYVESKATKSNKQIPIRAK